MPLFVSLSRALDRLYLWCGYAAAAMLVVLALLVVASIATRMAGIYVSGLTAYAGYAMAAASFLALAHTFHEDGHIRVAILFNHLSGAPLRAMQIWCFAVGTGFAAFFAWYLARLAYVSWVFGERSESADATLLWMPQSVAAAGALVLAICVAHSFIRFLFAPADRHVPGSGAASLD